MPTRSSSQSSNDIVALGELLIDFTEYGISEAGNRLFEQNPGGAPANMLTAATKLGSKTAFIGKVGSDMHGEFLRKTLADAGIDTSNLILDPEVFTTLAFVALSDMGEREFSFARKPGADTRLKPEDIDYDLIERSRVFHFGSLSLTDHPAIEATMSAVEFARDSSLVVTYDPNYRPSLWESQAKAEVMMKMPLEYVDILKVADNEFELITGETDYVTGLKLLEMKGIGCVVVTLGADGALVSVKGQQEKIAVPDVSVVDTTGAGDAFFGSFINRFLNSGLSVDGMTLDSAIEFARYANSAASICITRRGAIPAMPTLAEVEAFKAKHYG